MKRIVFLFLASLILSTFANAQVTKNDVLRPIERSAGVYHSYEAPSIAQTPAPNGYKPFFITHYGRHGSRWQISTNTYNNPLNFLQKGYDANVLTDLGKSLYERIKIIAADAEGNYGALSPRGVEEHHGIAERMFKNFPEVFAGNAKIQCRSTIVPRCILSMAAFSERLKELNPELNISRQASERYMKYLAYRKESSDLTKKEKSTLDDLKKTFIMPDRFVNALFTDHDFVGDEHSKREFMLNLYLIASDMQDIDYLNISLYDIFTEDELFNLFQFYNARMYISCGPYPKYAQAQRNDSKPLLQNIIESADDAIANGTYSATLRFGHDSYITPLSALMGIDFASAEESDFSKLYTRWSTFLVTPMAANMQMILYKNANNNIIVKILYNEREARIPVKTDIFPYYQWEDVRNYYTNIINEKTN